ncbi:Unknown protein sequence [Pseudomonas coronafaciens pv. oryzae]|nr:Unknown protein sequence [Pseudomonas coronafaciens pv. oryzae]
MKHAPGGQVFYFHGHLITGDCAGAAQRQKRNFNDVSEF